MTYRYARVSPPARPTVDPRTVPSLVIGPSGHLQVETWAIDGTSRTDHATGTVTADQLDPRHLHCDGDPIECTVQGLQGELDEARLQLQPLATLLAIVLELGDADVTAYDVTVGQGVRCVLCDATPPGNASTLTTGQHRPGCLWVRAHEFGTDLERQLRQQDVPT